LILEVPAQVAAAITVDRTRGEVKFAHLRGDHTIRGGARVEGSDHCGRVTVVDPRSGVQLSGIQGDVQVTNAAGDVWLREISGSLQLGLKGGSARIEQVAGRIRARVSNGRLDLRDVQAPAEVSPNGRLVELEDIRDSRVQLNRIE